MCLQVCSFLALLKWHYLVSLVLHFADLLLGSHSLRLIEGTIDCPLNGDWFHLPLSENLIVHSLSGKLCMISVLVFYEGKAFCTAKVDIINFTPRGHKLIDKSNHISDWSRGISGQGDVCYQKSPALLVEASDSRMIFLVWGMTCSTEDIPKIVFKSFLKILFLRSSMIESAIYTLRTCPSSKVYAEVCRTLFLKFISLGIPCIDFRVALVQRWSFFHMYISVSKVLIVPDVVVVITFDISSILLWFLNLPSCRSFHPFSYYLILKELKNLILLILIRFLFSCLCRH